MLGRSKRSDKDFSEEILAHLQLEADRLVEEGMDPDAAMSKAKRGFGDIAGSRERFYEFKRWMWLDHLIRDVQYAFRQMKRSPTSAVIIVLSLTLGIGASTAIFSLADQALLRALPVAAPARLVQLDWNGAFVGGGLGFGHLLPHPLFRDLRAETDVFKDVFARNQADVFVSVADESEPVSAEVVSGSYFPTLGVRPALGRLIADDDDLFPDPIR